MAESPEYRACSEWKKFLKEYDADGVILSEIGNETAELEEEYRLVHGCYSQEMADKVNELCANFCLFRLKGFYLVEDYADLCRRAEIGAVCGGVPGNIGWDFYYGYVYDDGTFLMEGRMEVRESAPWESESVSWVSDYQMIRTVKGSFNPVTLNVGEIDEYREWNYVTKSGEILLLANSSEKALIIADRKASFIVVNVLGDFSGNTFQVSGEMLEEMAEAFQFSEIP